ncbi:MAG: DNA primase family protein [Anaerovoracaceae bacterium]|jgi:P4 family phage/plasmid primase-like protien
MNKGYFQTLMHREPSAGEQRYIFLVDSEDLAVNIIEAGYQAVVLQQGIEAFFTPEELTAYMDSIQFRGLHLTSYRYVPASSSKKINDFLGEYFRANYLNWCEGWKLFKDKEYLANAGAEEEIKDILVRFIERHERKPKTQTNLDAYHVLSKDGEPVGVLDIEIVDDILHTVPFFVIGATPFLYENGVYREDIGCVRLKSIIQEHLYRRFIKSPTLKRICDLLISQSSVQRSFADLYNYPPEWVNFENGFYDPTERKLIPHDPKYLSINQIPHEFHPEKREEIMKGGDVMKQYLAVSLPDPVEQQMLWEYLGYCMTADTKMQKFLMLIGEGGTGKSVIIHLFQKVIGMKNCSCISLQDLNRRFYATGLFGKLLNTCGDIPCKALESIDVLKKAVGEDSLIFEKKSQDALQFTSHAKLLFSSNGMPDNVEEKSDAFYRRLLILEMNHKPEINDPELKKKMDQEIDYAIVMAMDALHRLYEQGALSESENSRKCVEEARKSADSVMAFISERLMEKKGIWLNRSSAYEAYEEYCKDDGRQPLGKAKFIPEMKRKGYQAVKNQGIFKYRDTALCEGEFQLLDKDADIPFE